MSSVVANNHQVGKSATPSQNLTWYQPSTPDGTVRLGVGNSGATTGDVITASSTGVTIPSVSSSNTFGFKNRLINGGMTIDQRNAGGSIGFTNGLFPVDRFVIAKSSSAVGTAQQLSSNPPVGFKNYLGITCTTGSSPSASDYNLLWHSIEGINVSDLQWGTVNAKTITISFQVYSSKTGTFAGTILNGGYSRGYTFTYTVSSSNTWATVSVTIPGDSSGTWANDTSIGIKVSFDLGSGSGSSGTANSWGSVYYTTSGVQQVMATTGATFYITGVQLEVGSQATSFDFRSIGQELALCQRYYQGTSGTTAFYGATNYNGTLGCFNIPFVCQMRSTPSISSGRIDGITNARGNGYWASNPSFSADQMTPTNASIQVTIGSAQSVGICCNLNSSYFNFSAEL